MKIYKLISFFVVMLTFMSCTENDEFFDNKIYIQSSEKVQELLLKGDITAFEKTLQVAVPQPAKSDIDVTIKAEASLLSVYNRAYGEKAEMLPAANYEIATKEVKIVTGNIVSPNVNIRFIQLDLLDRNIVYVLPVTITNADISILESDRTLYYVIKGASLINVVANIEENYLTINWANGAACNNLEQITMETLVKIKDFDRMISTVMGIEGRFLIRLGDANFPANQIQIATSRGNFPPSDSNKGLPTNEWVHIAMTFDSSTSEIKVYINGSVQSEGTLNHGAVSLGQGGIGGFCIGRSYSDDRYLAGQISECRIWNVVRTKEQIANNPYYVDPASEGLVAYWKFNDESALAVKDHTSNGNNAVANGPLKWVPVTLPEVEE